MRAEGTDGLGHLLDLTYLLKVLSPRCLFGTKNKHESHVNKKKPEGLLCKPSDVAGLRDRGPVLRRPQEEGAVEGGRDPHRSCSSTLRSRIKLLI